MAFPASLPNDGLIDVTVRLLVSSHTNTIYVAEYLTLVYAEGYSWICWRRSQGGKLLE